MIALEAMRFAMIQLQVDLEYVEQCIPPNDQRIEENTQLLRANDDLQNENDHEINSQQALIEFLQDRCFICENQLNIDRDALVLYCQQFAFAPDMVKPCSKVLTCAGTQMPYRWTPWV